METNSELTTVNVYIEIDENIYDCMQDFLASNPQWNKSMLIEASISLFLMQNHRSIEPQAYRNCSKTYIHSICDTVEKYSHN